MYVCFGVGIITAFEMLKIQVGAVASAPKPITGPTMLYSINTPCALRVRVSLLIALEFVAGLARTRVDAVTRRLR